MVVCGWWSVVSGNVQTILESVESSKFVASGMSDIFEVGLSHEASIPICS